MAKIKEPGIAELEAALQDRYREIGMLTKYLAETQDALAEERAAHAQTREALEIAELASRSYHEVIQSTSWRMTAPLRAIMSRLKH
ncbi:hypothetical protein EI983_00145 (plasmid) [Roseovarius faecimaris]|uniref:Uncharacterized protein n=1 Tax=Roseovarius faecimaris TaxID=2494550 RepID=A0A6I6IJI4_9RHOB|nr:hypothetical protein [Roseovarius faecimaris]QGX96765.1 hypothetical protein EI983_00145 [Roseovarius faecimaris]